MKRILLFALVFSFSINLMAQDDLRKRGYQYKTEFKEGIEVVCPASHIDEHTYRGMAPEIENALQKRKSLRGVKATNAARFNVVYDPDMPEVAQESFQRAVDIWAEILNSPVEINVVALWEELGPNVLGSAGPGTYYRNFSGAKKVNTWYPIALAEKMAGEDLNSPDDVDIVARFSADQNWYYGTTGTPAVGQFDFTSVVLHELCHGLGFVGSLNVEGTQGSYGLGTIFPDVFDTYVINEKDEYVTDTTLFPNPSNALRNELISENLFFDSPLAIAANGGEKVQLYAPTIFDSGSSISHLDDDKYPAGTENSLMTPSAGLREINYDPGPVTIQMMNEMGWRNTSIIHESLKDFVSATEIEITARIISDTTIKEETAFLNYVLLDATTATVEDLDAGLANPQQVQLVRTPGTDEFKAILPMDPSIEQSVIGYFLTVTDNDGVESVSPVSMPDSPYLFFVGTPDQWGPTIEYFPPTILRSGVPISFIANVEDDYQEGVDTVYVEYSVNGVPQSPFGLRRYDPAVDTSFSQGSADAIAWFIEEGIPPLNDNDIVTMQVKAVDASNNVTVIPTTAGGTNADDVPVEDFYTFTATSLLESVEEYYTDFNEPNEDFAVTGFGIDTPNGFSDGNLNTDSPYKNGLGLYDPVSGLTFLDFDYNAIALFRRPIILKSDSAIFSWDEIVLVEPGEEGSAFGDSDFWDFVVVEISADGGGSWFELIDGYDSREDESWEDLFVSTLSPATASNPTSNGEGSPALFRTREINLNELFTGDIGGAEVLLRFRLYADQWVKGWGWAIDNLAIQVPKPAPLSAESEKVALQLSPNPTSDFVNIRADFNNVKAAQLQIIDLQGVQMMTESLSVENNKVDKRVDVRSYNPGTYLVNIKSDEGLKTKKFVITK
ncbi:T9SS type A sorting domain-containing protein [Jiulongibacter sp. NS-SX5]|uniref:T9SS type A sorting domain-containing protein n=1 Tax=Jiulongibacter sp. NS-SX5 TaxID=3463854 RepID=UPI00405990E9